MSAQLAKLVLQVGSTATLARLLTPADFGLVAMVTVVTNFVARFKDAGLSMATVQREHISHEQVSTLFWINVAVSVGLALVVAALAPAVAWFYGESRLAWITVVTAGTLVFGGLTVQHQALLRRQMRFTALAIIDVVSLIAGIATAIVMAVLGAGYWALVGLMVGSSIVNWLCVWSTSSWLPGLPRRHSGVWPMLAFGGNSSAANFLNYIGANVDTILIGRWIGPVALGLYSKAYNLLTLPLRQMSGPLGGVAIPALSRANKDAEKYRRAFHLVNVQMLAISAPCMIVAIVFSDAIVLFVLGNQWLEAARIFAILGFAGLILPYWNAIGWAWHSQGRMREHLHFHCIDFVFKVGSILIGIQWGVTGVAYGVALRYYLVLPILFYMLGRKGPVRQKDLYSVLTLPLCLTLTTGAVALLVKSAFASSSAVLVLSGLPVALALTWLGTCLCTAAGRTLIHDYIENAKHLRQKTA